MKRDSHFDSPNIREVDMDLWHQSLQTFREEELEESLELAGEEIDEFLEENGIPSDDFPSEGADETKDSGNIDSASTLTESMEIITDAMDALMVTDTPTDILFPVLGIPPIPPSIPPLPPGPGSLDYSYFYS
jgi:hypothetical protein